jgi:hypothetical protein
VLKDYWKYVIFKVFQVHLQVVLLLKNSSSKSFVRFEQGIPTESFGVIREKSLGQGRYQNSTGPGCPWLLPGMTPYSCNTLFMGPYLPQYLKPKKKPLVRKVVPRYHDILSF